MAISYEQFKSVLTDAKVRTELGLILSDGQARQLLENEPQSILYFEKWSQGGQRRTDQYAEPATAYNHGAVVGFIASLVAIVLALVPAASYIGGAATLLGIIVSHGALSSISKSGGRGRGLAIAGIVLGYCALAALIGAWLATRA